MATRKMAKGAVSETVTASAVDNSEAEVVTATATPTKRAAAATKHVFKDRDGIVCTSCTVGELLVEGVRSKILYRWSGLGDKVNVEYWDLMSMLHSRSAYMFKPRFIIQDEEFLKENPQIAELYNNLYTVNDFVSVLRMSPAQMTKTLESLSIGAQDAIKGLAAEMIDSGKLDSINTIKALDVFYGTNLLLKLAQNS